MKILDVLEEKAILTDLVSEDKIGVLGELVLPVSRIAKLEKIDVLKVLMDRERLGSTGIGGGIGIPHCKLKGINETILGFGLSRKGVEFESIDGELVYIFFLLLTPEESINTHLKLLARISKLLSEEYFRNIIRNINDSLELIEIIKRNDV